MNKKFLIIGASSDVGIEFLKQLNTIETQAVFLAHYNSNISRIEAIAEKNNNRIIPIKANLLLQEDIQNLIDAVLQTGNIPSVLVHMPAPKLDLVKFKDLKWDECIQDIDVQVGAAMKIVQALLPSMIKSSERAKVVFVLSENTIIEPAKFMMKYTMSKYMLLGFMKALSVEYQNKNVNINALSPTMIDTKLWSNVDKRILYMAGATEKMLMPNEVANELIKLVSNESDNMYGQNIHMPSS